MNDAYAAGLIDGEGCIYVDKALTLRIDVGMTEKALPTLQAMQNTYGGRVRKFREATDKWETAWTFTIIGTKCAAMLEQLLPHLHLKWEQANLALALQGLRLEMPRTEGGRSRWTPELKERGDRIRGQIMALNKKGPSIPKSRRQATPPFARLVDGLWVTEQRNAFSDLGYETFSGPWPKSGFMEHGECWIADTSECPSEGSASSSLPDVLVADHAPRFFLSPKAAVGIIRRAAKRGRALPAPLAAALADLASLHREDDKRTTKTSSTPSTRTPEESTTTPPRQGTLWKPSPEEMARDRTPTATTDRSSRSKSEPSEPRATPSASRAPSSTRSLPTPSPPLRRLTPTERERLQGFPDGWTIPYGPSLAPSTPAQTDPERDRWATQSPSPSPSGSEDGSSSTSKAA